MDRAKIINPLKRYRNMIVLFVVLVLVVVLDGSSSDEFVLAMQELDQISGWHILGVLAMMVAFLALDGYLMHYPIPNNELLYQQSFRINLAGCFFSAVTPYNAASHPSRLYYLYKHSVPAEHAMTGLLVKGFTYQIVIVVLGLVALVFSDHLIVNLENYKAILWIGFLYNVGLTIFSYLLATSHKFSEWIIRIVIVLSKKKNMQKLQKNEAEIINSIREFYRWMSVYLKTKHKFFWMLFVTTIKVLLFYAIPIVILHGFGFDVKEHIVELLSLSALTSIVIATVPLPGGIGAAIGVFVVLFGLVYNNSNQVDSLTISLVVWRFFTYYLLVAAGLVAAVLLQIRTNKIEKMKV